MEQRTKRRRGTALFLALVMLVSLFPINVLAESDGIIVQEAIGNPAFDREKFISEGIRHLREIDR